MAILAGRDKMTKAELLDLLSFIEGSLAKRSNNAASAAQSATEEYKRQYFVGEADGYESALKLIQKVMGR